MSSNLIKSARIVAVLALACISPYAESHVHGGGGGGSFGLPTKGTCGFVFPMSYPFAYIDGSDPGPGWGMDALGTIDFQTSTISMNITLEDPKLPAQQYPLNFSAPFTAAQGPFTGSATITFNFPNSTDAFGFDVIPASSGKTFLLQQAVTPGTETPGDGSITVRCEMQ